MLVSKFVLLAVLLFSFSASANLVPTGNNYSIAGHTTVDSGSSNVIILGTAFGIGLNGGLRNKDGTAYTPSGSKKFIADQAIYQLRDASVTTISGPCSADAALTINDTNPPTNSVCAFGAAAISAIYNGVSGRNEANVVLTIPNGKFGYQPMNANATNGASVIIIGHEE